MQVSMRVMVVRQAAVRVRVAAMRLVQTVVQVAEGHISNYHNWKKLYKHVNIIQPNFSTLFKYMKNIFIIVYDISPHPIRIFYLNLYFLLHIQLYYFIFIGYTFFHVLNEDNVAILIWINIVN